MKDPMKMLRQVQQMQDRMAKVQKELEEANVEAGATEDVEMLQDLILAAVNEALEKSRELQATKMQSVTAGLGLPPGLLQ